MMRLKEKMSKEVLPALKTELGVSNVNAVPRLEKVVVNVGVGKGLKDAAFNEAVQDTLQRITGQKPIATKAKKSISNFKIREGQTVGYVVTLRGDRMYDFLDKLIHVTFPRVRDFRGIETSKVDQNGNLNIGLKEHVAFPEIKADEIEKIHGIQVTVVSTAKNRAQGLALFKGIGFPFSQSTI